MQNQFTKFEEPFLEKISVIDISSISNDKIVNDYLQYILQHKKYFLKIYSFVLNEALIKSNTQIKDLSILDFGCGNGLLALFAKYCGFKNVYACDYYSNFVKSANILSQYLCIQIQEFKVTNEYDLLNSFSTKKIDIIVGTDVIEHVYNLDVFYSNISALNPKMITAFTTASVNDNYFKRKKLEQLMKIDELEYIEIRKNIIHRNDSTFEQLQLELLSKATRGLNEIDITKFVNNCKITGRLNQVKINKYNTCDPITGNFTERILTTKEYHNIYSSNNFSLNFISGFYNEEGNIFRRISLKLINNLIKFFNKEYISRTITPFILLTGNSKK